MEGTQLEQARLGDIGQCQRPPSWWATVSAGAPAVLAGLWFGLVELAPGGWHIYVAGTERFDLTDKAAEWAVGPYAWWPDDRYFPFPNADMTDIDAALGRRGVCDTA